jgi:hypothetical protein
MLFELTYLLEGHVKILQLLPDSFTGSSIACSTHPIIIEATEDAIPRCSLVPHRLLLKLPIVHPDPVITYHQTDENNHLTKNTQ